MSTIARATDQNKTKLKRRVAIALACNHRYLTPISAISATFRPRSKKAYRGPFAATKKRSEDSRLHTYR
eukprot:scaffold87561_cov30-Tisochrysis_lutea.AAC.5